MPGLDKVLWLPRGIHSIWQGRQMGASIKAMCSRVCAGTKAGTEVGWEVVNVNVFHFACVRVREVSRYCWYFSLFDIHQHKMYCFSCLLLHIKPPQNWNGFKQPLIFSSSGWPNGVGWMTWLRLEDPVYRHSHVQGLSCSVWNSWASQAFICLSCGLSSKEADPRT